MLDRIISNDIYDPESGSIRLNSSRQTISDNFLLSLVGQLNEKLVQTAHGRLRASFGTDKIPTLSLLLDELSSEYSTVFYDVMAIADSTSKTQRALKDHCHSYMRQLVLSAVYAMFLRVYKNSPSMERGGALEQQKLPDKIAKVFDSLTVSRNGIAFILYSTICSFLDCLARVISRAIGVYKGIPKRVARL